MEYLKHECGVAMIRLLRSPEYYAEKYGTDTWAVDKLYLLMEKQHNRGQEAAGVGMVSINARPGTEFVYRQRALGSDAIRVIFENTYRDIQALKNDPESVNTPPSTAEILMGHLRYSTTGRSGMSYVHPFLRRNNWRSRNLLMCGNFNMTNVDEIFDSIVSHGQHPRMFSDTVVLLEQLGYAVDHENHRLYREFRNTFDEPRLTYAIDDNLDLKRVLLSSATQWDGGFVICGATGSGSMFVLRDASGIRPAFYFCNEEVVVIASERPVIQTVFDTSQQDVKELAPGQALIVNKHGQMSIPQILKPKQNARCSFERIYFSRGSDSDIYNERKALGANLVPDLLKIVGNDLDNTVFSFIPNTAEVAFRGMTLVLEKHLDSQRFKQIQLLRDTGKLTDERLQQIMRRKIRIEKVVIKDIKLRTFIAEKDTRNNMAAHVYDVTYGTIRPGIDTLVVIDDSIVRGTTLQQSILRMLDRLNPRRIVVVSSSPQVRYPDYYGIDMSRMNEFISFRAAVDLLRNSGRENIVEETYRECLEQLKKPASLQVNAVKKIYEQFSDKDISDMTARLLVDKDIKAEVVILYQTIEGLHKAVPDNPGDWYFSGDYPTPGGTRLVNRAFVNFYEGHPNKR